MRRCSKPGCHGAAVATLTYVYADSTAVVGPLATYAEPHCYDLCARHGDRLTAPLGWEIVRLEPDPAALLPSNDDLEALADLVREVGRTPTRGAQSVLIPDSVPSGARRGHLRALRSDPDPT